MERDDELSVRRKQAIAFGERLQWARKRKGFRTRQDVFRARPDDWSVAERTYYSHERGERIPDSPNVIAQYCAFFGISRDFLILGQGAEGALFEQSDINHRYREINLKPSQIEGIRAIPILRASDIDQYLQDKGTLAAMTKDKDAFPLPASIDAGPNAFAYEIHPEDDSMVGLGSIRNFCPRSFVICDPDSEIKPGQYLLVKFPDWPFPMVRQFMSSRPYKPDTPHFGFTLKSANDAVLDNDVYYSGDCDILGRIVFTIESL